MHFNPTTTLDVTPSLIGEIENLDLKTWQYMNDYFNAHGTGPHAYAWQGKTKHPICPRNIAKW